MSIIRNPAVAAADHFDLIIVGGGVYGAAMALESAQRGLRPLLLEQADFGHATSWNCLRIIHGGLRYLQSLNVRRMRESIRERAWFLRHFPEYVQPMACLLPLYGQGLRRPAVFRSALRATAMLTRRSERQFEHFTIPPGEILTAEQTVAHMPDVAREGLRGAGLWYDAVMSRPERVLIEMLRWAAACGAVALNYVQATSLLTSDGRTAGVQAVDVVSGQPCEFRAPLVVNCGGPWCRELAVRFDRDYPRLFHKSLAFNVLLNRNPPAEAIVGMAPGTPPGPTCFLVPWGQRMLAGTWHCVVETEHADANVSGEQLQQFLDHLNRSAPHLKLVPADVQHVFAGLLPARTAGTSRLATRPRVLRHSDRGGPDRLYSVSGVKFTTARLVAEQTLNRIYGRGRIPAVKPDARTAPKPASCPELSDLLQLADQDRAAAANRVRTLIEEEAVLCQADLMRRRTDWHLQSDGRAEVAGLIAELSGGNLPTAPCSDFRSISPTVMEEPGTTHVR